MSFPLNKDDFKKAYRKTLMTHPDKSGLDKKYFLFFKKAFQILKDVYNSYDKSVIDYEVLKKENSDVNNHIKEQDRTHIEIMERFINVKTQMNNNSCISRNRHSVENHNVHNIERNVSRNIERNVDRTKMTKRQQEEFNAKFNRIFSNVKIHDEEQDSHYDDWWLSEDNNNNNSINQKCSNISQMNEAIYKQKKIIEQQAIQQYRGIQELESSKIGFFNTQGNGGGVGYGGSSLIREKPEEYGSELFSKLKYEDLRKAHMTETVIPVTEEEVLKSKTQYNSVNQLKNERSEQLYIPTEGEMKEILEKQKMDDMKKQLDTIYKMNKQMEQIQEAERKWNSQFYMLTQ
jgi:phage replication-related protein YjqB (UPF0714/DUF867 family)